jgi:hypothetical protein
LKGFNGQVDQLIAELQEIKAEAWDGFGPASSERLSGLAPAGVQTVAFLDSGSV